MDELLEQFVIETRELVDQAYEGLLGLEQEPDSQAFFDDTFRAFHTLKGGAGIVGFGAMETLMHRAESVLAEARTASTPLSRTEIADCFVCLDQVEAWLDAIETTGALPPEGGPAALESRFERAAESSREAAAESPSNHWLEALVAAHPDAAGRARTAIRYRPDSDCFFAGSDPLADIGAVPGLLALVVEPVTAWPELDELDPYVCNIVLSGLSAAAEREVQAALGEALAQCDLIALDSERSSGPSVSLGATAKRLLDAQAELLRDPADRRPGVIASAGLAAANILRALGRQADAERLSEAATQCLGEGNPDRLRKAIESAATTLDREPGAHKTSSSRREASIQTLRIDAARIDHLLRVAGELVVAKNALGHVVRLAENDAPALAPLLKQRHATLERLVDELQDSVAGARMLPLRSTFRRFPKLIRELSADLMKPTRLVIEGEDTEADRTIAEIIVEPLLHALRNAMVHGIEEASERAAAGKPARATILLTAARQGDHVVLEVRDDGAGVDVEAVREAALDRGLLTAQDADELSDDDVIDLIFTPGFSTASKVTDLSGRGVGMDAVRSAVRRLGGQISVRSVAGQGMTVRFALPFSVMTTRVMTVEAGGQSFGIPLDGVVETLRLPADQARPIGAARAVVVRDRTLPLVDLAGLLGEPPSALTADSMTVVVVTAAGEHSALRIDRVGEPLDIVLKPLEGMLAATPGLAGAAVLGDGGVLLVLDLEDLLT